MTDIADQEYAVVPIDSIHEHTNNPRQGDVGAITQSIERLHFFGACIVQASTGRIIAGNHRYRAAKALGMTEIPVLFIDYDDADAVIAMLADNRTSDLASYNDEHLAALLGALREANELAGTGYDGSDLDALLTLLAEPLDTQVPITLHVSKETADRWRGVWNYFDGTDDERLTLILNAVYEGND